MKLKRIFALILLVTMAISVLSGCGGEEKAKVSEYKPVVEEGTDGKITKDPLTLTAHVHMGANWIFVDDEKMPIYKEAGKYTNIFLKGTASEHNLDQNSEFNIMLASEPLPDIIHKRQTELNKIGVEGALIPLNGLIEDYAPNIKRIFEEYPDIRRAATAMDGNIYYIPHAREGQTAEGFFIRKDWLDNLGLDYPKTVDEYYNVLKAFREQDPNQNGVKDEVPYFDRTKSITRLMQLFDVKGLKGRFYVEDDKVGFGMYDPAYKVAMTNIAKWYKERLIDQEIFSRTVNVRDLMLGDNIGGSTHDWFTSTASYNDTMKEKIPGFEFVAFLPPANVNGEVIDYFGRELITGYGWGISKDNEYVVETMKYLDFWYSDQGQFIMAYGVEGVDYNMVNGEPVPTDTYLKAPQSPINYMRERGRGEIGTFMPAEVETIAMSKEALEGSKLYEDCTIAPMPALTFTVEEEKVLNEKQPAIDSYLHETQQKWVMGMEDVETNFDKYMNELKNLGMDDVLKIYQAAYDRYLQN